MLGNAHAVEAGIAFRLPVDATWLSGWLARDAQYTRLELVDMAPAPATRILVADDDAESCRLVRHVLELAGYEVTTVESGTAALERMPRLKPDLVVLDVSMPGASGYDVCQQLSAAGPGAPPVILLSAHGTTSDRVTGLELGAVDYVVKPFDPAELTARVRVALRQKAARDALAEAAATDWVTGLLSRRELDARTTELILVARRHGRALSCLMIDIDYFKEINDRHGHSAGDEVLRQVAARLRATSRASDIAGRYGGEEFVLLLPETSTEGAVTVAEKVRAAIAGAPMELSGPAPLPVRVSIGVATRSAAMMEAEELYSAADGALYQAKQSGRDRVVVAPRAGLV
jgi:two-component system, cell cycle response regulator